MHTQREAISQNLVPNKIVVVRDKLYNDTKH